MKVPVNLLERYARQDPVKDNLALKRTEANNLSAEELDGAEHVHARRRMLASVASESLVDAFERYIGSNDLLPINYLEIGYRRSKAVGRLHYFDLQENKPGTATGFLVSPDLVMTNWHVFSEKYLFRNAQIEFNYQYDLYGRESQRIIFELDPDKFFYSSEALDFALIGVKPRDQQDKMEIRELGYLVLNGTIGKAGKGDFASIIQHPQGKLKQIALRENQIVDISRPDALIYLADTTSGSSGSPVFNDQWQIIALHSAGVPKKNDNGDYVDRDNNVILPENGRIDESRVVWLNNRGIRISAIWAHLFNERRTMNHPLILQLATPSYSDDKQLSFLSMPPEGDGLEAKTFSQPSPATTPKTIEQPVSIHITVGGQPVFPPPHVPPVSIATRTSTVLELEKKLEDEMDYSSCKGYDEFFMTDMVPMPELNKKLKRKVALFTDGSKNFILDYHHYSTVHHAIRRQPVFSAINIYGHLKRYDELSGRKDNWFRDRRIDMDVQLTDDFYSKSGFDRGHMARREDAEWSPKDDIDFAELAANMTCSYTNACPQVPTLNRSNRSGLWGQLEEKILEEGVFRENGKQGRICVFNGPFFEEDDPHFKGIQIPMSFWKVVVWRDKLSKLRTTCFKLTQEDLVSAIEFEVLRFDKVFKNYQCSIKHIERKTGLYFTRVREWDTFDEGVGEEERLIEEEAFGKLILAEG